MCKYLGIVLDHCSNLWVTLYSNYAVRQFYNIIMHNGSINLHVTKGMALTYLALDKQQIGSHRHWMKS